MTQHVTSQTRRKMLRKEEALYIIKALQALEAWASLGVKKKVGEPE